MEKLKLRVETATKALRTLKEIIDEPYSTIIEMPQFTGNLWTRFAGGSLKKIESGFPGSPAEK